MGLIQRAIEAAGVATVSLSLLPAMTEKARLPRAVAVRWPFGHALGEPLAHAQQMTIIHDALAALYRPAPGAVTLLPYRWRRERYAEPSAWPLAPPIPSSRPS